MIFDFYSRFEYFNKLIISSGHGGHDRVTVMTQKIISVMTQ